jgi:NAD(P)-dependent dehydrogenase (short-subunit alcohol dehydrogenase family)
LRPGTKLNPEFVHADLRDLHLLKGTIESIQRRAGPVKILVNNAANDERHEMEEITPEYWRDRLATNLDHYFFVSRVWLRPWRPPAVDRSSTSVLVFGAWVFQVFQPTRPPRLRSKVSREDWRGVWVREISVSIVLCRVLSGQSGS